MNLLETYDSLLADWRHVFPQNRTFERARRLTFGLLVCLRQHLTSRAICAVDANQQITKSPKLPLAADTLSTMAA